MDACDSRRCRSPSVARRHTFTRTPVAIAAFVAIFAMTANCAVAADPVSAQRYRLDGAGAIALDASVQRSGNLRLEATLSPSVPAIGAPFVQSNGRFALTATLAAQPLVCYSDTIFRDDFDADGF
jgi:hypothetical protein